MVFTLCADILAQTHCLPGFVIFLAAVVSSVQGFTLLTVHLGIILFIQILYSLAIFMQFDDCTHEAAYSVSFAYGLSITHGKLMLGPVGALTCLAFALMTTHYVCRETLVKPQTNVQNEMQDDVDAL